jgi:hypothetical protein
MIPFQYYRVGRIIMDYLLLHAKTIQNYIPYALKREDPKAYTTILHSHAFFFGRVATKRRSSA